MPLRAVTLDLWQTLLWDPPEVQERRARHRLEALSRLLGEAGLPFPRERIGEALRRCQEACEEVKAGERDLPFREQVALFLDLLDGGLSSRLPPGAFEAVASCYGGAALSFPPSPAPGAREALRALKGRGLLLGLISNTGMTPGRVLREVLDRAGLFRYLDTLTFSDEVGLAKPSPAIFHLTLRALGVPPGEAVHVGDHPQADVVGARRAGLRAVLLVRRPEGVPAPPPAQGVEPDLLLATLADLPEALARLDGQV